MPWSDIIREDESKYRDSQPDNTQRVKDHKKIFLKRDISIKSLPSCLPVEEEVKRVLEPEGMGAPLKQSSLNQYDWCTYKFTGLKTACIGPSWVLCVYIMASSLVGFFFYGIPEYASDWVSLSLCAPCAFSRALFLVFACFVLFQHVSFCLMLFYFAWLVSVRSLFSNMRQKGDESDGSGGREELGGIGWKTIIRIYYVRKIIYFHTKKKHTHTHTQPKQMYMTQ